MSDRPSTPAEVRARVRDQYGKPHGCAVCGAPTFLRRCPDCAVRLELNIRERLVAATPPWKAAPHE